MFEPHYDALKRRLTEQGWQVTTVASCQRNTPEYEAWMGAYLLPGTILEFTESDDHHTATFYTLKKKETVNNV